MDAGLKREIEAKVYAGERLTRADGVALYDSDDLAWLGRLAHHRRGELNGDRVTFTVSRHLALTNVCTASCVYCGLRREPGDADAYTLGVEEAVRAARELADEHLAELYVVTGLHPTLPWSYYPAVLRELRAALPGVSLTGFGAAEVRWFEKISGRPAEEILDELLDAGLESLTGGGAEILDDSGVRSQVVDHGCHWADWSRIHRLAHGKGMKTASGLLYGHVEQPRHRVDHVLRLRELQDETNGFATFVPLPYRQPVDASGVENPDPIPVRTAPPAESLKTFAVSRLLLDNVPHVTCPWVTHGLSMAQLALNFGADDLDGSAGAYKIQDAGAYGPPGAAQREDLLHLIWDAGLRPVERDARHAAVREHAPAPSLAERRSEPQRVWA